MFQETMEPQMATDWKESPEFWRSAFHQHGGAIHSYLQARTRNLEDADDLLQETFVKAIHATSGLKDITKIRAYLFSIAHNLWVNSCRNASKSEQLDPEKLSINITPEHTFQNDTFQKQLEFILKTLSGNHRKAFEMAVVQGYSYQEISNQTGWSLSAVKVNIYRARKQIIKALKQVI